MVQSVPILRRYQIAIAGNPNSGKTSMFNALTGANQRVGNYPGVTVEKKEGRYRENGVEYHVLDLPGAYSLSCFSPEERIARREIQNGAIDAVVVVADSTNLDRNLYLLLQIMEMGVNTVLALNMSDEAAAGGQRLDVGQMQTLLGIPVVETVGHRGGGVAKLKEAIRYAVDHPTRGERLIYPEHFEAFLTAAADRLRPLLPSEAPPARWLAIKLAEDDEEVNRWLHEKVAGTAAMITELRAETSKLLTPSHTDAALLIADLRYAFIAGLLREVRLAELRVDARRVTDFVDGILCHRLLGIPIFIGMMYLLFWATFSLGAHPMDWLEAAFNFLAAQLAAHWPAGLAPGLESLLIDGIIGGVGGVLVFLPPILILFLGLALLEDTGYLARAAFLMDRLMHRMGLHGKSFVPMLTGFGCSIPGIMACRTLDNERDRLTTMLVLPLMSCGARLPIYLLLIPSFFPENWQAPMLWLIYLTGILLAIGLARLLRSTVLAGEDAPFVMELPPYRLPTFSAVARQMVMRAWLYLRKAGTIILAVSVIMWFASSYPEQDAVSGNSADSAVAQAQQLEHSVAGRVGKLLTPVTGAFGADWRVSTALLGAFAAKEVFVAQVGVVFSLGEVDETSTSLRETLRAAYTPLQGLAFMLFLLIATPCMATVAVMRRETGSWKWPLLQFAGLTFLGWLLATLVYQFGRLFV